VVVIRRQVRRAQVLLFSSRLSPCLIGIEACAGAHYWARDLTKLGHEVRLIPPSYVKPVVKRGKTDGEEDRGCSAAAKADERCGNHLPRGTATDDALRSGRD
jgi:transposase